jgi:hypothetical protein
VLVMLILLPLFVAIIQLGLTLYVRNTLAACAQSGARYGANADFVSQGADVIAAQAQQRTSSCINSSLSSRYSANVQAAPTAENVINGSTVEVVEVNVKAPIPVIGFWALGGTTIAVKGDALQERLTP